MATILEVQYLGSELTEKPSLQGFRKEVGQHVSGWTILHRDLSLINAVGDKEVPSVNVLGPLAAGRPPVPFHQNCALVILEHDVFLDLVSLRAQEPQRP